MACKTIVFLFVGLLSFFFSPGPAWADLVVDSQSAVEIELTGYRGLSVINLFKGELIAGKKHEINTTYCGLAFLTFAGGQRYPVILGDKPFTLKISDPDQPPAFVGSAYNDFFYKSLSGEVSPPVMDKFANLMLQAKDLLVSSNSIKTIEELAAKKKDFYQCVGKHYDQLKNSDMIMRLIAQYFMMHEYVDYHVAGEPTADIRASYQREVISGVGHWLEVFKPHLPKQDVLNYCVSLYYNRSMVTLASLIIDNYRDFAYCEGEVNRAFSFSGDLAVKWSNEEKEGKLDDIKGRKLMSFVSADCPVSMVETVIKIRHLAAKRGSVPVIVAPLERLSDKHLSMARMLRSGEVFFVDDEEWRKENLQDKIRLPLFLQFGGKKTQ